MNQTIKEQTRDYVEHPPTVREIRELFWERVDKKVDVYETIYDIISDFDHHFENEDGTYKSPNHGYHNWFNEDESDEKDSLMDETLTSIRFFDYADDED
tara:strand:- start:54 stop:350 length:297 start_codon:yes stop_codon:yes gene_type:complete